MHGRCDYWCYSAPGLARLDFDEGGQWFMQEVASGKHAGDDQLLKIILAYFKMRGLTVQPAQRYLAELTERQAHRQAIRTWHIRPILNAALKWRGSSAAPILAKVLLLPKSSSLLWKDQRVRTVCWRCWRGIELTGSTDTTGRSGKAAETATRPKG